MLVVGYLLSQNVDKQEEWWVVYQLSVMLECTVNTKDS